VVLYLLTIATIGALIIEPRLLNNAAPPSPSNYQTPAISGKGIISGKPIRIVIPGASIDLSINEGRYYPSSNSWTTSPVNAEFATISMPANNHAGTTYIYGHGTDAVFGRIGEHTPPDGTLARIYTDNNHVFTYRLKSVRNIKPEDTSILDGLDKGSPQLLVQTCTGTFSEWRTIFDFTFENVDKVT